MPNLARSTAARLRYLAQFARNPRELGSVTPSSRWLSRAVSDAIDYSGARRLVELGPGTGAFTRLILDHMHPEARLLAIETNLDFVDHLREIAPDDRLHVVNESAEHVDRLALDLGWHSVDVVVSGLPYSLIPPPVIRDILAASSRALRPGGLFVGYQYSRYLRPYLVERFGSCEYRFVLRNIPPAFVYVAHKS
jgi:phospholipid N-methyltransferase